MKRTVYLVLDKNDQPLNGAVHATEEIARGFKLNGEQIVPARLTWPIEGFRPVKLCLRKVISRKKVEKGNGFRWALGLECGHGITRQDCRTSGRGGIIKQANCEKCFEEGFRTGDKV